MDNLPKLKMLLDRLLELFKRTGTQEEVILGSYLEQIKGGEIEELPLYGKSNLLIDNYGRRGVRIRILWGEDLEKSYYIKIKGGQEEVVYEGFFPVYHPDW